MILFDLSDKLEFVAVSRSGVLELLASSDNREIVGLPLRSTN